MKKEMKDETISKTLKAFKKRLYRGYFAENREDARKQILDLIPVESTVCIGDSSTVRQIEIVSSLKRRGTPVVNPFDPGIKIEDAQGFFDFVFKPAFEATTGDVFLTGSNALTQDGVLLNIDGAGNRVAGMFWGHPISIIVVGRNKIVKDLDEAFQRVKNVIAPEHFRRRGAPTPCTVSGRCHDCSGPKRICAVTTIIERSPIQTEIHIILVNEDLGLGFSRDWPRKRIDHIVKEHEKFSWSVPHTVLATLDTKKCWEQLRSSRGGLAMR
ncbi:MAG TPA: lactate utilization protein [Syntrophorhabdaceae bacterium]|nr:lactate utilization protein [Syntrophorhabdaceae bacterium]